jgi:hypothetical protein
MGHRKRRLPRIRPTFANCTALLALLIALSGTSVGAPVREAASSVAKALGLARHADTTARTALKTARRAERTANSVVGKVGTVGPIGPPGPPGPPGLTGSAGAPGSARGFAAIEYCPGSCPDQSAAGWFTPDDDARGIDNQANFSNPANGTFCLTDLPFHVQSAVANVGLTDGTVPASAAYFVQTEVGTTDHPLGAPCTPQGAADSNVVVVLRNSDGSLANTTLTAVQKLRVLVLLN